MKLLPDELARVLACGIDTLVLAIDVSWPDSSAFSMLTEHRTLAEGNQTEEPVEIELPGADGLCRLVILPHGAKGYEWLLRNADLALRIGNWLKPQQRPSVMAELRSEFLWRVGPERAVEAVLALLRSMGADIVTVKPSRADLAIDLLLRRSEFTPELKDRLVTRARQIGEYFTNGKFSGISIGRGKFSARIYDKLLEIMTKLDKLWMFDVWGIGSVGQEHTVVRVEFQIRREALKELIMITWEDLKADLPALWAYCAKKWLRVVEDPSLHHTQQGELPWWTIARTGFTGAQSAEPLVRQRVIQNDLKQLAHQALGGLGSVLALTLSKVNKGDALDLHSHLHRAVDIALDHYDLDEDEFTHRIIRKQHRKDALPDLL